MRRDNPATAVAACTGCATSWRGLERAHCRECHVTFDDEVLFDGHRLTGRCVPPERLDLVAVGQVWCRLLTGQQRGAARARFVPDKSNKYRNGRTDHAGQWVYLYRAIDQYG